MDLKEKMKTLECHFNWGIEDIVGNIDDIMKKEVIKSEEFPNETWCGMLVELNLAYELYKRNNRSEAEEKVKKCLKLFGNINDNFFNEYKLAFKHVLLSLQLFVNFDKSSENDNKKLFNEIPAFSILSENEKTAIIGIKAYCFGEYGEQGRKHSLSLARKAHQDNPNEPEWCFMIGLALSRIRNYTHDNGITDEEVNCIEKAYKLRKSSYFAVYLAQTYLDYTKMIRYQPSPEIAELSYSQQNLKLQVYYRKAYQLFKEIASRTDEKDVHIIVRCARGLFQLKTLKPDLYDINEALIVLKKCLNIAPNYGMCHTLATSIYCELHEYEQALKHSIKAKEIGDYFSSIRIIQLKCLLQQDVNAAETFDYMLKKHPTETYIYQTHLYAISYYIFKERNLQLAVKHFLIVSKLSTMERQNYEIGDPWVKGRVDLCDIMYNEVRCAIDGRLYQNDEEKLKLEEAYEVFKSKYPDVTEKVTDSSLVENLLSKNKKKWLQKC
ncbi:hypothetical protein O3M35_007538 [Rhynocoris fuscipes]|uniref:Uncharacterized protein n=1 Tax=Rhynocoris fuscipes TaxID=488301 RepID=A0AAW1D9S1_9HEMI